MRNLTSNGRCDSGNADIRSAKNGYLKMGIILFTFAVVILFRCNVIQRIIIYGESMKPTLTQDDVCFVRKFHVEPKRYDIVTAKVGGQTVIKRVIGLPGDILEIKDGYVFVNNIPVLEKYNYRTNDYGVLSSQYIIGNNEYFLMGDNRNASVDSRKYGSINIDKIAGIVVCRIYPFGEIKRFPHGEE